MSAPARAAGVLRIVGLGPGGASHRTAMAAAALAASEVLLGYGPYLDRVALSEGQVAVPTDNREELERARDALARAVAGQAVALVSSGDPGVFAMASAVMEAVELGPPAFRAVEIEVVPGVTAALAAAARLGAPLGHDFCVLSLSDNLKPFALALSRLEAAVRAGFAVALYNAVSRARPHQLEAAFAHLRTFAPASLPVAFVTAATRPEERIALATLGTAAPRSADMRTLVLIGTREWRRIERPGRAPLVYAPRAATRDDSQASA